LNNPRTALIVDDSVLIRKVVRTVLENMNYKIVGEASNGIDAIKKVQSSNADLLIMDVMMPKMDGLTALSQIMKEKPIKTLVVSAYDPKQMDMAYKSLEIGALSFIQKNTNLDEFEKELKSQVKISERANVPLTKTIKNNNNVPKYIKKEKVNKLNHLLILGASTGGPSVIHSVISKLRKPFPPVILIQHLPSGFTQSFATRLQTRTNLNVVVAKNGMKVCSDTIFVAPSGKHLVLKKNSNVYIATMTGDRVNGVIPSLDPTIMSASHIYKDQLTIAIFTGMGNDGLAGVRSAKQHNAFVLTQDKESCVIYGMPKVINDENLSDYVNTPNNIISMINQRLGNGLFNGE
jgi:two-component system chemotaxis response regulator CheB